MEYGLGRRGYTNMKLNYITITRILIPEIVFSADLHFSVEADNIIDI